MARERHIRIGGINIRVHTKHQASEYAALWQAMHRLRRPQKRGATATMIGDVRKMDREDALFGYIYRFVDIDPADPWFNIEEHKKAEADDVAEVRIPAKLKPNLQEFPYVFDLGRHKLYFKTGGYGGGVSPGIITTLVQQLALVPRVAERFGEIDVTMLTKKGALEALLSWPEIRRIEVVLQKPNPSDFDDDQNFYERLKRRSLKREEITYVKAGGTPSITPDDEMQKIFKVAEENGEYRQTGVAPDGNTKSASTKDFPLQEVAAYDPDKQMENEAFRSFVAQKLMK